MWHTMPCHDTKKYTFRGKFFKAETVKYCSYYSITILLHSTVSTGTVQSTITDWKLKKIQTSESMVDWLPGVEWCWPYRCDQATPTALILSIFLRSRADWLTQADCELREETHWVPWSLPACLVCVCRNGGLNIYMFWRERVTCLAHFDILKLV